MTDIKSTLEFIVKAIVPDSKDIVIEEQAAEGVTIFEISAPSEFIGRIIGKEGKIIKSIRTILNLSFPQSRFILKIKD